MVKLATRFQLHNEAELVPIVQIVQLAQSIRLDKKHQTSEDC